MKWHVVFAATFLMLLHNGMSYGHRWHQGWGWGGHGNHYHDSSSDEGSFSGDGMFQEHDMSNSGPDSDEINSPEFFPYHRHHHGHFHHCHNYNCPHMGHNRGPNKVYTTLSTPTQPIRMEPTTTTTAQPTTESTTKPTTESTTKPTTEDTTIPTIKSTTEPRAKRTIKPDIESTLATTTDASRDYQNCVLFCPVTSEYNPVCGTNLVTYTNLGRLNCAKRCGLAVDILRESPCPRNIGQILSTSQSPSTTTTTTTTTTAKSNSQTTPDILFLLECMNSCDRSSEWRPVCGSDDVTYNNTQQLICAQYCGIDVKLKKFSPCTDFNTGLTTSTTTPRSIETVSDLGTTSTLPPFSQFCIKGCPVTTEHNPVCGTNDVTYKNPSFIQCLITCGMNIQIKNTSPCVSNNGNNNNQPTTSTTSVPVQLTTSLPPYVRLCVKACPILNEDKPICGTDGVTYKNPSHLQCAKVCGVGVQIKHKLACPQEHSTVQSLETTTSQLQSTTAAPNKSNQETCIDACQKNSEYNPVCGSNNVTYRNLDHLKCAISCNVDVSLETFSACTESSTEITTNKNVQNVITTSTTSVPEVTTISKDATTIDLGTLSMIFNIPTTTESRAGEIDPRFGMPA